MKNISKTISIFFLSFSILLLFYVFYRSQILANGTKFDYYLKYYIIAFLSLIFSFVSFFISEKSKIVITAIFLFTLTVMYCVEGYLIYKYHFYRHSTEKEEIFKKNTGRDWDHRNKYEVYRDLKKDDPNANIAISIYPAHFIYYNYENLNYLPLSSLPNHKMIHCNENGYTSIYQTDRYGFRNIDEEWNKNEIEFFLIGDEMTHGACVNEPDTISGNLKKLNDTKNGVLNLGYGENGPLFEYATLREYLQIKKVKRVLWFYYEGNDLVGLSIELKNKILVNYLENKNFSQNIILRKKEIEKFLLKGIENQKLIEESLRKEKFAGLIKFLKLYLVREVVLFPKPLLRKNIISITPTLSKEFEKILKMSKELVKENNSKLYFVYLPNYIRYIDNNNHDNLYSYKKVTQIVQNLNIPIIDINKELFEKHKDQLSLFPFRKLGHYNEKGYELIAETVFDKIKELEK